MCLVWYPLLIFFFFLLIFSFMSALLSATSGAAAAAMIDLDVIISKLLLNPKHNSSAAMKDESPQTSFTRQSRLQTFQSARNSATNRSIVHPRKSGSLSGVDPRVEEVTEAEVVYLVMECRKLFMSQPVLVEIEAPVKMCGDIHGQYHDLLRLFDLGGYPPETNYIFLGDYVDRGDQSLECICLLFAYKLRFPDNFFLLRGNHESSSINRIYGFFDECKRRFNVRLWKLFTDTFNCLPVAGLVDERILCMHGGLSPELRSLDQIRQVLRPTDVPDSGLICDLLWSDPCEDGTPGWGENDRGVSWTFGEDVVETITKKFDLDLICRAHQVVDEGYLFFAKRKVVTVFSAPNYCGEFNNAGAFLSVDANLMCSIIQIKPTYDVSIFY